MKTVSGALLLIVFWTLPLSGCGQKGPLFLPGEAPESQTDGPFSPDPQDGGDANGDDPQSSSVPAGTGATERRSNETLVPPANAPLPDRLTSPLGTP